MNQKMTPHERRAVKRLRDSGVSRRTVAEAFGVSPQCVDQITLGRWTHAAPRPVSPVRGVAVPLASTWRNSPWAKA